MASISKNPHNGIVSQSFYCRLQLWGDALFIKFVVLYKQQSESEQCFVWQLESDYFSTSYAKIRNNWSVYADVKADICMQITTTLGATMCAGFLYDCVFIVEFTVLYVFIYLTHLCVDSHLTTTLLPT